MSADKSRPGRDSGVEVIGARPSSPTSDDLREYLPPRGAAGQAILDASMAEPCEMPDPALVEKLRQMNEAEVTPLPSPRRRLDKAALPGAVPAANHEEEAKPVTKPAPAPAPHRTRRQVPAIVMVLSALLAVAVPVVVVIVLMGRETDRKIAAAMASAQSAKAATTGTSTAPATPPSVSANATGEPAATGSPSTTTSAEPSPSGRPHGKPRPTIDDPYDGAPPAPAKTSQPAVPSATAPEPAPTNTPWF